MAGGVRGGRDHPGLAARTPAATSGKPAATRNNSGVHGPAAGMLVQSTTGRSPRRSDHPSCPGPGRAGSTRLAASALADWPRSCAPAAGQARCRRRASRAAGPGRAADRSRAGDAAADRRGQVKSGHRPRPGGSARHGQKHVTHLLGKLGAANRTEAAARARQLGLIPWHRTPADLVARSCQWPPRKIPPGRHLRVMPCAGGNPYGFPKSRATRAGLSATGLPRDGVAGRGDETQCSRSVSTGRGPGASTAGPRSCRPTRGTPMWSGPRRSPVPVIASPEEHPGRHLPPGPPRRRADGTAWITR